MEAEKATREKLGLLMAGSSVEIEQAPVQV
jgi:hypothetical protein